MRPRTATVALSSLVALAAPSACVGEHGVQTPARAIVAEAPRDEGPREAPPDATWLIADPQARAPGVLALGDAAGLVVDGVRILSRRGSLQTANDVADPPLTAALAIPSWLGGGYLFHSRAALFASATFTGPLRPLAALPAAAQTISFTFRGVLVTTATAERLALTLPDGARQPIAPAGAVDVAALGDGRGLALLDRGVVAVTTDGGRRWTDVPAALSSPPDRLQLLDGELWLTQEAGPALRLEPVGQLAIFDRLPAPKPVELRPRDPRWHGDEAPLRRALRHGAIVDERTAVVVSEGDLVRIALQSGEIVSAAFGQLPPDAQCDGVRTADDTLFACGRPSGGPSFVVAHAAGDRAPVIEQSFGVSAMFYTSEAGGLAFAGPCTGTRTSRRTACVRSASGGWRDVDLDAPGGGGGGDAGVGTGDVARWIPGPDGELMALIAGARPLLVDTRSGTNITVATNALPPSVRAALGRHDGPIIDRSWTVLPSGGVRGWADGATTEIAADGAVTTMPNPYESVATAGRFALARRAGRLFQSSDFGATWGEVDGVPAASQAGSPAPTSCSPVGCIVGGFYRIGWPSAAVHPSARPSVAAQPPHPRGAQPASLSCRPSGEPLLTAVLRSDASPGDLGLGAERLSAEATTDMWRFVANRTLAGVVHDYDVSSDAENASPRAIVIGPDLGDIGGDDPAERRKLRSLTRSISFVLPFDAPASIRRAALAASDALAAARSAGLGEGDVLSSELLNLQALAPMTPRDPGAAGELAFSSEAGLVGLLRGARPRVTVRARPTNGDRIISAASLAGDEVALLDANDSGTERVLRWTASGLRELFELPAYTGSHFHPANPDALAVGPRGELAVIRTRSGGEPPSELDPAVLLAPQEPPTRLAPWSTLTTDDDPACRSDASGYRATIQAIRPWIRLATPDLRVNEAWPMLARVRWSPIRVCLEAIELRVDDQRITVRVLQPGDGDHGARAVTTASEVSAESFLTARFSGKLAAARSVVAPGIEARRAFACGLAR